MIDERDGDVAGRPGSIPPPADPREDSEPPPAGSGEKKRLFERAVPVIVKRVLERAVESGVEKLTEISERPDSLRHFISELRLPKEVLGDIYAQIDDTKNGLYRVVAKEIRDVLEQTQIADEIVKALTKLSFEIKTEIRFVPNDRAASEGAAAEDEERSAGVGGVRPKVTSEVTVKDRSSGSEKRKQREER
ncbi:MAG: hypothetical protein U0271_43245 [Polyangiaceae bacterium]